MSRVRSARFRRSPHLVSYWRDESLVIRNYATGVLAAVPPSVVQVLNMFDEWRPVAYLAGRTGLSASAARRVVAHLEDATFLQRWSTSAEERSSMDMWKAWNPAAGFFHTSTRDVRFLDPRETDRDLRAKARRVRMPPPVKRYPAARRYELTKVRSDGEFAQVLLNRRTWRQFARTPLALDKLGVLLGMTGGIQHWASLRGQGDLPLKTSPSGGARHPIELYVFARRVEGLPGGLYHYDGHRHGLNLLATHRRRVRVQRYLPTQFWYEGAAALVFFTAVTARYLWKYTYARAYRALLIEAGHQCQTFCLSATWLGLAPFCSMALADSRIEQDLGLDGVSESVLYAAGVGMRPAGVTTASKPAGYRPLQVRPNPHVTEAAPAVSGTRRRKTNR
jgi:SagB-type dehydrogenase family enzyme